jgi:(1->4)-alpha-D-glucan 1-alpha-D-glucosylmutase
VRVPAATYRVQLSRGFRIEDATKIVDYLHDLGITDLYASPIMKARPGSNHGYDVIDPTTINPEIGTFEEFSELSTALQNRGMNILLDIVPNHMAASPDNPWWFDLLEKGEHSEYASFFDVNWESKKILLPILGRPYGEVLENRELVLGTESGRPVLKYHEQRLPLAAGAESLRFEAVDQVLSRQHYRLAFWRKASDGINYRRFFDVTDLIGLRAERDDVFQATHAVSLSLFREGKIGGFRVDHIDGLLDPKAYLDRFPQTYLIVEKILGGSERLPADWNTSGTTGYDFLNFLNGIFIDAQGYRELVKAYSEVTGLSADYLEVFHARKRQVMEELFEGEITSLVRRLSEFAEEDRHARDLGTADLREAFVSVIAALPVYRTYIRDFHPSTTDRTYIEDAIAASGGGPACDFLRRVLLLEPSWYLQHRKSSYLDFVMRWQQVTGPVMAKGLEDTTFYVVNPLVSVNEVGGDCNGPETHFGVEQFHQRNQRRLAETPHSMNATSTHDTKRSEDVRARINVLSELPSEWTQSLKRWFRWFKTESAPDMNEQMLIYQAMLGAWPIESSRVRQYVTKALREAKTHTNWLKVNTEYEDKVMGFIDSLYGEQVFMNDFNRFHRKIAWFGALSSLSQVVLKIASPGVPDIYRGTELWDFSLADPDNRRPVEFESRTAMLDQLKKGRSVEDLLRNWADGGIKMFMIWKALTLRRTEEELFQTGEYIELKADGACQEHVVAFARRLRNRWCIAVVPRLLVKMSRSGVPPLGSRVWKDTTVPLPEDAPPRWKNIYTGEMVFTPLGLSEVFKTFPFGLLVAA